MTLKAFVQQCSGHAEVLFDPNGQMMAHIVAEEPDGKISVFVCPMGPDDEVMFRVGLPRSFRVSRKYQQWCFFAEAWTAVGADGKTGPLPVNAPDRMEVVVFNAEDLEGRTLMAERQIFRFPGMPARLLPLVFSEEMSMFVMDQRR